MRTFLAAAALALASCGTANIGGATNGTVVTMQRTSFSPATLSLALNATVTWRNTDTIDHTVTSGQNGVADGKFDHNLHPGETFSFTFKTAGTYPYFCRYHWTMGMTGSVAVGGAPTTNPGTTTTGGSGY